ncbi:hypothetical protein N7490_009468 [Penicillium lividum]|nr:hypothetical protein N7490_009468 [Penicillium lividum]
MSKIGNVYQDSFDQLQAFVNPAGDKRVVLKEHALFVIDPATKICPADSAAKHELLCKVKSSEIPSLSLPNLPPNHTVFPDEFLASWFPVLLIRHPAIAYPLYYRTYSTHWAKTAEEREAVKGEIQTAMTLLWARSLYDWYLALWEQVGSDANLPRPIVLDAEDYMSDPKLIERFCDTVGLDSSKLQLSWEPASKEALEDTDPGKRRMRDTLFASTADWVKSALPDYEFLRERGDSPEIIVGLHSGILREASLIEHQFRFLVLSWAWEGERMS